MPELPEVETTIRYLKKRILNRKIEDVWSDAPKQLLKNRSDFNSFQKEAIGRKILGVRRLGKNILIDLSGEKVLLIHQKMTGHLLVGKWKSEKGRLTATSGGALNDKVNGYIHLIFTLSEGIMLALSDVRKFAKAVIFNDWQEKSMKDITTLGPDPLKINFENFKKRFTKKSGKIKQVLTDQSVFAGIGNIYSDEILWEAGIHPLRKADDLSQNESKALYSATRGMLKKGIKYEGASMSDYRKPDGMPGGYASHRKVYRKTGEKCARDGAFIKRMKIGGRSAHYCPYHQR